MKIAIIGRTKWLLDSAIRLQEDGHEIVYIITSRAAPEYEKTEQDFENFADENNIPYRLTQSINSQNTQNWLDDQTEADVAVSINYTGVLGESIIGRFEYGVLNAHAGDLPRYRGNACVAWAIVEGEKEVGLCIHKMIPNELDSGDIIARSYFPLTIETSVGQVFKWMDVEIVNLVLESIKCLDSNSTYKLHSQSDNKQDSLRCYPRNASDASIDWSMSSEKIIRLINASSEPFSGAYCNYSGNKIVIWKANLNVWKEGPYLAVPGQVLLIDKKSGNVVVACGKGSVELTEIEYLDNRSAPAQVLKSVRSRLTNLVSCNSIPE